MKRIFFFKSIVLILFSTLYSGICLSQNIGISSTGATPDASAMLDIVSSNKGLLIPRVSLTSTTDVSTITSPLTSLLAYNTNGAMTNGSVGYWSWNGTRWVKFSTAGECVLAGSSTDVDGNTIDNDGNVCFPIVGFWTVQQFSTTNPNSIYARNIIPRAGTLKNLYVNTNIGAGAGENLIFTIYNNGVATSLSVTLNNINSGNDLVNTVSVAAGDIINIVVSSTSSPLPSMTGVVPVWSVIFE